MADACHCGSCVSLWSVAGLSSSRPKSRRESLGRSVAAFVHSHAQFFFLRRQEPAFVWSAVLGSKRNAKTQNAARAGRESSPLDSFFLYRDSFLFPLDFARDFARTFFLFFLFFRGSFLFLLPLDFARDFARDFFLFCRDFARDSFLFCRGSFLSFPPDNRLPHPVGQDAQTADAGL